LVGDVLGTNEGIAFETALVMCETLPLVCGCLRHNSLLSTGWPAGVTAYHECV